jgi:hypothetical protein
VAEHAGWANLVCVAAPGNVPAVVERRRVTTMDPGVPTQPYHHDSLAMTEDDANALIQRVRRKVDARTAEVLQHVASELASTYVVVALVIRQPPFDDLPPTVVDAWNAKRLLYAADGMMYQLAFCRAARQLGLDVQLYRRGEESSLAAQRLGVASGEIDEFVSRTGRPSGPPWTQEHRRAFAAGIATLAGHTRRQLAITT